MSIDQYPVDVDRQIDDNGDLRDPETYFSAYADTPDGNKMLLEDLALFEAQYDEIMDALSPLEQQRDRVLSFIAAALEEVERRDI